MKSMVRAVFKYGVEGWTLVARMKLQYFGHVTRGSAGDLAPTVLEGSIHGLRHQGRPKRQWMDDIEECSDCSYTFS